MRRPAAAGPRWWRSCMSPASTRASPSGEASWVSRSPMGARRRIFVYMEHAEGQQIMLCQRHGRFETGPMQLPFGQGAMFQIYFQEIGSILANLVAKNWPLYLGPREVWRKTGDRESGQREVFVQ